MIIKCPECDTGFVVPPESLAPSGRKVKCSNCQTQWFQKYPIDDNPSADDGDDAPDVSQESPSGQPTNTDGSLDDKGFAEHMDDHADMDDADDQDHGDTADIPDGVKPQKDDLSDVNVPSMSGFSPAMRRAINYGTVGIGFALALTGLVMNGDAVTSIWPDSRGFYNRLGYDYKIPGEHVEFDRVRMDVHLIDQSHNGGPDRWELQLSGYMINLSASPVDLPLVKIDILDANHYKLATHIVPMAQTSLDGEAVLPFNQNFAGEDVLLEAKHIALYFDKPEAYRYEADIEGQAQSSSSSPDHHGDGHGASHGDGHSDDGHGDDHGESDGHHEAAPAHH